MPDENTVPPKVDIPEVSDLSNEEKIWAAVSYIPLVSIYSLLTKKNNTFIQFHAKQGLILTGVFVLFSFFQFINIIRYLMGFQGLLIIILGLGAYAGNWWKIPGVYDISTKIK